MKPGGDIFEVMPVRKEEIEEAEKYALIEMDDKEAKLALAAGLLEPHKDGGYISTDKGNTLLNEWLTGEAEKFGITKDDLTTLSLSGPKNLHADLKKIQEKRAEEAKASKQDE